MRAADCRPYDKAFCLPFQGRQRGIRFIYKKPTRQVSVFFCVSYLVKKVVKALYAIYTSILATIS